MTETVLSQRKTQGAQLQSRQ